MIVVIKRPGEHAVRAEIGERLEDVQVIVGGYIETCIRDGHRGSTIWSAAWCDEEGLLKPDPKPNIVRPTDGHVIVGTIVVTGMRMTSEGADWCSLPDEDIGRWRLMLDMWDRFTWPDPDNARTYFVARDDDARADDGAGTERDYDPDEDRTS